jgi:hypothetical protein
MEALHVANQTVANGIRHQGALLEKIDELIEKIDELRDLFAECVPDEAVNGESPALATVDKIFLNKYSKIKTIVA